MYDFLKVLLAVWLALLLTDRPIFARESKEQKLRRASDFWSGMVALHMAESQLAHNDLASSEQWLQKSIDHFDKLKERLPREAETKARFHKLQGAIAKGERGEFSDLTKDIYRGLDDLPLPTETPERRLGERIYLEHCASCHGLDGAGKGVLTKDLRRPPQSFLTKTWTEVNAPIAVYASGMQGVEGSEMSSYRDILSPHELWSVAFYVSSLIHRDQMMTACSGAFDMTMLVLQSDSQLRDTLATLGCEHSLSWLRWEAPFEPTTKRSLEEFNTEKAAKKNRGIYFFGAAVLSVLLFFSWLLYSRRS